MTNAERELEQVRARERAAEQQIALLEARLADAERAIAEMLDALDTARATLDARDREVEALRAHNEALQHRNREAEATAAHFRAVNDGLMSSVSWRATRPLRALKRS